MVQYLQLEKRSSGAVNTNDSVDFNVLVQSGGSAISYDMATRHITFHESGVYYLSWFVAQQTGLATDGSNFAIITSAQAGPPGITGSNHIKISQTNGFAIIKTDVPNVTAQLVNVSDASAQLSNTAHVKAGLAVFGLPSSLDSPVLGYMQAQVSAATVTLQDGAPIYFDYLIEHDPDMIVDKNNTQFILKNPGTYLVTWEIPVDATDTKDYADITINYNGTAHSTAHIPLPIGVLSGSAMIVNTAASGIVELFNTTGDIVRITGKANIVITQITKQGSPAPIAAQLEINGSIVPGLMDVGGAIQEFNLIS